MCGRLGDLSALGIAGRRNDLTAYLDSARLLRSPFDFVHVDGSLALATSTEPLCRHDSGLFFVSSRRSLSGERERADRRVAGNLTRHKNTSHGEHCSRRMVAWPQF